MKTATHANQTVVFEHFQGAERAPNRIEQVYAYHFRRALKAGLIAVEGRELVLTPAGQVARDEYLGTGRVAVVEIR